MEPSIRVYHSSKNIPNKLICFQTKDSVLFNITQKWSHKTHLAWHLIPAVIFLALSVSLTNININFYSEPRHSKSAVSFAWALLAELASFDTARIRSRGIPDNPTVDLSLRFSPLKCSSSTDVVETLLAREATQAAGSTRHGLHTQLHPTHHRNHCFSRSHGTFPSASSGNSVCRCTVPYSPPFRLHPHPGPIALSNRTPTK